MSANKNWLVVPECGGSVWDLSEDTGSVPTGDYGHDWVVVTARSRASAIATGNRVLANGDVDLFDDALTEDEARKMFAR